MTEDKIIHLSVPAEEKQPTKPKRKTASRKKSTRGKATAGKATRATEEVSSTPQRPAPPPPQPPPPPPWYNFVQKADNEQIKQRFADEAQAILQSFGDKLSNYTWLALLDPDTSIGTYDLDKLFNALLRLNLNREKDVLLFLLSTGGSIEPAYQISKLCKTFAKQRFSVAVPRQAKSAATLLALGADEIHLGPLGHLGPIDPQLGGLPALGVSQALRSIAALSEQYPGSAEMFAKYLNAALTVEQIGYSERISESAAQYAERLLLTKPELKQKAKSIANDLVYEYKHHGFVIDVDEAQAHLGTSWVKTGTPEVAAAEQLYMLLDEVNLFLNIYQSKRVLVIGGVEERDTLVFDKKR